MVILTSNAMFVFTRDYAGRRRISKRIPGRSDCTVMRGTPGALCRSGSGGVGAPNRIGNSPMATVGTIIRKAPGTWHSRRQ